MPRGVVFTQDITLRKAGYEKTITQDNRRVRRVPSIGSASADFIRFSRRNLERSFAREFQHISKHEPKFIKLI